MILLISNGHLVPARIVVSRSIVLSANMYSHSVDLGVRRIIKQRGRPFEKYVTEVLVV